MIDHTNRLIFVHLEKAGGTSIERVFTGRDWWQDLDATLKKQKYDNGHTKHLSLPMMRKFYSKCYSNPAYRKFCIVRHPYSLFISKCNWKGLGGVITAKHIDNIIAQNFDRWGIRYLHEFIGHEDDYDFVIRYENYAQDFNVLLNHLKLDPNRYKLIQCNKKSHTARYKSLVLSDKAKQKIREYCAEYCRRFDYTLS